MPFPPTGVLIHFHDIFLPGAFQTVLFLFKSN